MCNCKICSRAKKFMSIIKVLDKKDQVFMENILNALYDAEEALSFYEYKKAKPYN